MSCKLTFFFLDLFLFLQPALGANVTLCRKDKVIRLNLENVRSLDDLLVAGFRGWVNRAPAHWKADGFLMDNSPIIVTSCFGQNAAIALKGNERREAAAWDRDRDYSKIAFITVAIATSIKYALSFVTIPFLFLTRFLVPFIVACRFTTGNLSTRKP